MGAEQASGKERADAADLLGVAVDAPVAVIQRAFRSAVKEAHPDGGATDGQAFGQLHAARELLLSPSEPEGPFAAAKGRADTPESAPQRDEGSVAKLRAESEAETPTASVFDPPMEASRSPLFGRGVLLMAAGMGLLIGLLVATAVVAGNETQSVRIAPVAEAPDDCIVVTAGTIQGASCNEPGALTIASQTSSSAACATGTTRLEIPNGDTFCLRPEVQD